MVTNYLWQKVDPQFPGEGEIGTGEGWEGLSRCTWKTLGGNNVYVHYLDYSHGYIQIPEHIILYILDMWNLLYARLYL